MRNPGYNEKSGERMSPGINVSRHARRHVCNSPMLCFSFFDLLPPPFPVHADLDELSKPLCLQPSYFLKGAPKLTSLIDINLASLLTIRLPKLLSSLQALYSSNEDSPLARQICCTVESEVGGQSDLIGMEEMYARVFAEINRGTFPFDFQGIGSIW